MTHLPVAALFMPFPKAAFPFYCYSESKINRTLEHHPQGSMYTVGAQYVLVDLVVNNVPSSQPHVFLLYSVLGSRFADL